MQGCIQVGVGVECGLFSLCYHPRNESVLRYLSPVVALYLSLGSSLLKTGYSRIRTCHPRGVDGLSHWFDHVIREPTILVFYGMITDFPIY
jgi:hypothetical protein